MIKGPSDFTKLITKALNFASDPGRNLEISTEQVEQLKALVERMNNEPLDVRLHNFEE